MPMTLHARSGAGSLRFPVGALACVLLPSIALFAQETARLSYALGRSEISAGEPVDVIVQFENLGTSELVLETGDNGVGNFAWTVIGLDGKLTEYPYRPPSGDIVRFGIPAPGRQTIRLQLILDERTPFREPGRYMITIRHLPNGAEGSLSLLVTPRDEQKLTERCRKIISDLKETRDEPEKDILLGRLYAFRDPAAVPYILEGAKFSRFPKDSAMEALARFDTPDAVQAMLDILDRTKGSSHEQAWSLTYRQAERIKDPARRTQILTRLLKECTAASGHPSACPATPTSGR